MVDAAVLVNAAPARLRSLSNNTIATKKAQKAQKSLAQSPNVEGKKLDWL
jgi:hypothetical protein